MALRHYLRPEAFVDTPVGNDGQVARLAGGLLWHAAYELIAIDGSTIERRLVPVAEIDAILARVPDAARLQEQRRRLAAPRAALQMGERTVRLDQPQVMGILNMTPDSFSDGGRHGSDGDAAASAGFEMTAAGAAIIDVGGESTRPGAATVWEGDEISRVVPVVERLARQGTAVSIDTRKAGVMEAAVAAGARLVNDVSALGEARSAQVVAHAGCPVVLMHHMGDGLHDGRIEDDPLTTVYDWLETRVEAAVAAGIDRSRILVDPGIGFGKRLSDNLALVNGIALFHALGCAVVLGASRKRVIGALDNEAPVERRLGGSVALAMAGIARGVQIVRVHDVPETVQAIRVWRGLRDAAITA